MRTALDSSLLVVTGKGGVGKTTIAAAIGLLAAERGRRTIVVELGQESRLPGLFGVPASRPGLVTRLQGRLSSISIDPDRALLEWLQALGGRVSGRVLASSGTFQYFAAAAPGAKELVTMVKVWQLTRDRGRARRAGDYDLVVLDAPATGHALGMLGSPRTFGAIARVGPIVGYTRKVQRLLESPSQTAFLAVALATEMAVTEALELEDGLQRELGRGLTAVVVNALLPRRFTPAELGLIEALEDPGAFAALEQALAGGPELAGAPEPVGEQALTEEDALAAVQALADAPAVTSAAQREAAIHSAVRAARAVHDRARFQHNQLARLRRRSFEVMGVPFSWEPELDLAVIAGIAKRLERKL